MPALRVVKTRDVAVNDRASPAAIAVTNLEVIYPTQDGSAVRALRPLSIAIRDHEFVSMVGPSGCGKSTLLKIVAGLVRPSAGTATVHGAEVTGPTGNVGMVFQNPVLLPWKTVLQNVMLPIEVKRKPIPDFQPRAMGLLTMVGLRDFCHRYPHELSGGMQQRAAIGRAFVYSVSREFVAQCTIPMLVMPGTDLAHPLSIAEEIVRLAPRSEFVKQWKGEARAYGSQCVRDFLVRNTPRA